MALFEMEIGLKISKAIANFLMGMMIKHKVCSAPLSKKTYSLLQSYGSKVLSELQFEVIHLHFDDANNLISIVTTNNLNFPFQNDVNFLSRYLTMPSFLGLRRY